jgi:hypothetical protein
VNSPKFAVRSSHPAYKDMPFGVYALLRHYNPINR